MTKPELNKRVAIIGAGLIGCSWAALFMKHGWDVTIWDRSPDVYEHVSDKIARALADLEDLHDPKPETGSFTLCDELHVAISDVAYVQENVSENLNVKHVLLAELEKHVAPTVPIASSTTAYTWSDLFNGCMHKDRFLIAHPFNPPHLIPLVELSGHYDPVLAQATKIYEGLGRVVIALKKEAPGHIANRLAAALWREAVHLMKEGVADVRDIDNALVHGPGLRWATIGPSLVYHLGGGDGGISAYFEHLGKSQEKRWDTLGTPKLDEATVQMLVDMIEREYGDRSSAELAKKRDDDLIGILKARKKSPNFHCAL
jgi:carnitine 3-dehydrogenase